jgi:hypothetical protein
MGDHIRLDAFFDALHGIKKSEIQIEIEKNEEARRESRMIITFISVVFLAITGVWWLGAMPTPIMIIGSLACGAGFQYNIRDLIYLHRARRELTIREVMEA